MVVSSLWYPLTMKILVPIDNSECSRVAVEHLRLSDMARGARVRFVHVRGGKAGADNAPDILSRRIALDGALAIETLFADGPAADSIVAMAAQWQADLIAIGTHDRRGLERVLLGSVSQSVLSKATCPVTILRDRAEKVTNVLVAADNSESSSACLEWLSQQTWVRSKRVFILSVVDEAPSRVDSRLMSVEKASELVLRQQYEQSRVAHLSQSWSELFAERTDRAAVPFTVVEGEPTAGIVGAATQWPIDLIVLGSHCRAGISKLIHGSVSESVAEKAPCSVLVVRGREATYFEKVRRSCESTDLGKVLAEKTHPAKATGGMVGSDFNGFFPSSF